MDPDANFAERIAIMRAPAEQRDTARFDELTAAYTSWRAMGGFVADPALRNELLSLIAS